MPITMRVQIRLPNLQPSSTVTYTAAHRPDEDTPPAMIEAYHLETISHHSTPNWTVCFVALPFSPPPPSMDEPAVQVREMTLSASHWASSSSDKANGALRGVVCPTCDAHLTHCFCFARLWRNAGAQKRQTEHWTWPRREFLHCRCCCFGLIFFHGAN